MADTIQRAYVLTACFDFEGEQVLGVFSTPELAKTEAERRSADCGHDRNEWSCEEDEKANVLNRSGGTYWIVRECIVVTEATAADCPCTANICEVQHG